MGYTNLFNFYRSSEWEKFRKIILLENINKYGELMCEHSGKPIVKEYDAIVHHKIPLTESNVFDHSIALNPDNVMVVSHKSHNEIHNRFGTYTRHVYLVYGAPCSGKSTYVDSVAGVDDLVVDIDKVYQMISVNEPHVKRGKLKDIAFRIHRELLDIVECKYGWWNNAYIIGGYPLSNERERVCKKLGAEPIFIDTNKELCLARANERGNEYKKYIEDWFYKYSL